MIQGFESRWMSFFGEWQDLRHDDGLFARSFESFRREWHELPDAAVVLETDESRLPSKPAFTPADLLQFVHGWHALPNANNVGALARFIEDWNALPEAPALPPAVEREPLSAADLGRVIEDLQPVLDRRRRSAVMINAWDVAGLKRNEVRITGVLGWLLDPRGTHGHGSEVLQALLAYLEGREGRGEWPSGFPTREDVDEHGKYRVRVESCPIGERDERVDIEIEAAGFLMFIEVKVDAVEGPEQLPRYRQVAAEKATHGRWGLIFLTTSRRPKRTWTARDRTVEVTWAEIGRVLARWSSRDGDQTEHRSHATALVKQYATFVTRL